MKKRDNYENTLKNEKIIEEDEEKETGNRQSKTKTSNSNPNANEYKISINACDQNNNENSNSPTRLIKHDYNIYINNITFKEIESSKKKSMHYQEKFAKIAEKELISPENSRETKEESPKKYTVKTSPIVLEAENRCSIINRNIPNERQSYAKLDKKEKSKKNLEIIENSNTKSNDFTNETHINDKQEETNGKIKEIPSEEDIEETVSIQKNDLKELLNQQTQAKKISFQIPTPKKTLLQLKETNLSPNTYHEKAIDKNEKNREKSVTSFSKSQEIVPESEDSEEGSSSCGSIKNEKSSIIDLEENIDKMEVPELKEDIYSKEFSLRSGSKSSNSEINRLSKISKTSLGKLCGKNNFNFNKLNQNIHNLKKEEQDIANCFSKPQMIVILKFFQIINWYINVFF